MEKSFFAAIVGTLVIALILQGDAEKFGKMITRNRSCYTVHRPETDFPSWEESKTLCEKNGSALVSIEVKEELSFLKQQLTMNNLADEYFIGLRNVKGNWQWISNSSLVLNDSKGLSKLVKDNGHDCVKMYFEGQDVVFDDIDCTSERGGRGYICEQPCPCQDTKGNRPSGCWHSTAKPPQVTSASESSTSFQQQSGTIVSLSPTSGKVISDVPSKAEKDNSQSINIALSALAVIILAILMLIWFFLGRRAWSKASSLKTRPDDGNQHQENSNQITMHANLTPSEEGLDTYETGNEDKHVHMYENIENGNKMPGSASHRESSVRAQEPIIQTQSGDDYLVPSDLSESMETTKRPDPCDENFGENETTKKHVYTVVHVHQGQARAIFTKDTTAEEQSLDLTGASHLPFIGESREETENSSSVISEKTVSMTEDYLYAVVDKANQKRKPPQMPAPYHSHVYADLSQSPEKSAGSFSRRSPPTIYAAIDYGKTHEIKSKLPVENVDQSTVSTDGSE